MCTWLEMGRRSGHVYLEGIWKASTSCGKRVKQLLAQELLTILKGWFTSLSRIEKIWSNKRAHVPWVSQIITEKTSGTTKVNRQAHQLKKEDGTLPSDDTEKATMLNDYFCTVAEKFIGPEDEIQPLHTHSRENVDTPTMTSITISQKQIEEKFWKLKVKKGTGPDGVYARLLKYADVFKKSFEACKPQDQWKIARVSAAFKKGREEDRTCYRPLSMLSIPSKLMESCVARNITH